MLAILNIVTPISKMLLVVEVTLSSPVMRRGVALK